MPKRYKVYCFVTIVIGICFLAIFAQGVMLGWARYWAFLHGYPQYILMAILVASVITQMQMKAYEQKKGEPEVLRRYSRMDWVAFCAGLPLIFLQLILWVQSWQS